MKRTSLLILIAASIAALLLIAAAAKSYGLEQPHPHAVASWLSAILALGVAAVMLSEHFIHGRQVHLYLGGAFLSIGIMGVWDALTFPYTTVFGRPDGASVEIWRHLALWGFQWITLALMLLLGLASVTRLISKQRHDSLGMVSIVAAGLLWASLVIFLVAVLPSVAGLFALGRVGAVIGIICMLIFLISGLAYSRVSVHRNNAVLLWMSYGLVFAVLALLAMSIQRNPSELLFKFAAVMKVLAFVFPLAGMLAEHTRLQMRTRDQASDLQSLIQAQHAVSTMSSPTELFQRMVDLVAGSMSATAVCLMPFDKDRGLLRAAAHTGLDEEAVKQLIFRPGEGPPGSVFSDRSMHFIRDIANDPILAQKLGTDSGIRSAVFMPLNIQDECLGVLALLFSGPSVHKISKEQTRLLEALTDQVALAVDGFRMRGRVMNSARTTDDYAREMEVVWEIGQAVASKLELHELVDTLAKKLKSVVGAKTCSVLVFESDITGLRIMGHQRLTRLQSITEHVDQCDVIAASVAQNGESLMVNDIPNSCHCKYPDMALEDDGTHHLLVVPMSLRGFLGAIAVFRQNSEPFTERERRLLTRLSPVVATGIRNADLYERQKRIADSLQKNLLPDVSRDLPGIQVAGEYQAAYDESEVGGDFYEVLDLGNGRYGVALGDVAGKGLNVAVHTATARHMIQAYSTDDPHPRYVVSKLNSALYKFMASDGFVTVIYGVVDTNAGTFTYVNAGQETPFVYRSQDGTLESLQTTGPAAGALEDGEYTSEVIPFEPGDMLIFYTDGATEARIDGRFLGTEGLKRIVAENVHRGYDALPRHILSGVRTYAKGHLRDDVAILVVKSRTPGVLF